MLWDGDLWPRSYLWRIYLCRILFQDFPDRPSKVLETFGKRSCLNWKWYKHIHQPPVQIPHLTLKKCSLIRKWLISKKCLLKLETKVCSLNYLWFTHSYCAGMNIELAYMRDSPPFWLSQQGWSHARLYWCDLSFILLFIFTYCMFGHDRPSGARFFGALCMFNLCKHTRASKGLYWTRLWRALRLTTAPTYELVNLSQTHAPLSFRSSVTLPSTPPCVLTR